jgi:hypothetical protein
MTITTRSSQEFNQDQNRHRNIVEALSMKGLSDIDVEFPRARELPRPADFLCIGEALLNPWQSARP